MQSSDCAGFSGFQWQGDVIFRNSVAGEYFLVFGGFCDFLESGRAPGGRCEAPRGLGRDSGGGSGGDFLGLEFPGSQNASAASD